MRTRSRAALLALTAAIALAGASGCAKRFRVVDPGSGRVYYAKKVKAEKLTGVTKFTDARTGNYVRLTSAEIRRISKSEYKQAIAGDGGFDEGGAGQQ